MFQHLHASCFFKPPACRYIFFDKPEGTVLPLLESQSAQPLLKPLDISLQVLEGTLHGGSHNCGKQTIFAFVCKRMPVLACAQTKPGMAIGNEIS